MRIAPLDVIAAAAMIPAQPPAGNGRRPDAKNARARRWLSPGRIAVIAFVCGAMLYAGINSLRFLSERLSRHAEVALPPLSRPFTQEGVQKLLTDTPLVNRETARFEITRDGQRFLVETTFVPGLQKSLVKRLDPRHARYIGIVAITPSDGRIVGLAGFDRSGGNTDPCLGGSYPAASVFKIVTAAAAVDDGSLTPRSVLTYNGQQHTLYRRQLQNRKNRYSNRISLTEAFAESVNPVFGKIGIHTLGAATMAAAAERFAFNTEIHLEKPVTPSTFSPPENDYELAELASGFNRSTRISPLHGAMMAAAVVNDGRLPQPVLIEAIYNENGRRMYTGAPAVIGQAATPAGAAALQKMMRATVSTGTCRKLFYPYRRDRTLSRLAIGGKSGSIDNRDHDARYDWFVGFAEDQQGNRLAVAAVVAHHKYIGVRAGDYARHAFKQYFKEPHRR